MRKEVSLKDILIIMQRAFNAMDQRLLDHGEKVAYILLNLLRQHGGYSEEEMIKLCTLAVFHDIGAYKVAERDKLLEIDSIKPINHAVYGSLFIKYFSPIGDLSNVVLGHHFTAKYLKEHKITNIPDEALLLGLADYISLIELKSGKINKNRVKSKHVEYTLENINLFLEASKKIDFNNALNNNTYKKELHAFFDTKNVNKDEIIKYTKMLTYAIDFRSEATVRHTIVVEAVSYQIAKLYGFDDETCNTIRIAAMLHDIGKIAIPISILEKPGKLTESEFEKMKDHVSIGYKILSNLDIDDIRDIAMAHHEKLDGMGYPFGLKGDEISNEARIVAVGDIFSALLGVRSYKDEFSKDKIIMILKNMSENNKIDSKIVDLVIKNYDCIIEEIKEETDSLIKIYENMKDEYNELLKDLKEKPMF